MRSCALKNGLTVALAWVLLTSTGCINIAGDLNHEEVARVTSPGGDVDAVLVETNGGATTSYGYDVYLVDTGDSYDCGIQVASLYGAVRSEHAYGANLTWENPQKLTIEYLRTKIEPRSSSRVSFAGRQIEVSLRGGINDEKAPSGGMLKNLRR